MSTGSPETIRVLFVDDEERVLSAVRRALRTKAANWEVLVAASGPEALKILAETPVDFVISDMRMPGMDGAQLLHLVQEQYPKTVRIVLSGHCEEDSALQATQVAHRFLTKPLDANELIAVVTQTWELLRLVPGEACRAVVGGIGGLPAVPRLYSAIRQRLQTPDWSLDDVATLVETEPAVCSKLLQVVNSAFFGLSQPTTSARRAISFLGAELIQSLVLSIGAFTRNRPGARVNPDYVQQRGFLAATIVRKLFPLRGREAEDAYSAALIHDIGYLVDDPDRHQEQALEAAWALSRQDSIPLFEAEEAVRGVSHAEMGAYLLGLWGVPHAVVLAVAMHHRPDNRAHLSSRTAVYLGALLADEAMGAMERSPQPHEAWLASLHLEDWSSLRDQVDRLRGDLSQAA